MEYDSGYQKGLADGKASGEEEHKEALAEEHQRGLREGTDKGYDKGYKDGYDAGKKELDYVNNDVIATEEAFNNLASKPEEKPDNETVDYADVVQLITERNLYKTFYEQLLEVMKS
jgi:flagellar biosynthesis/type III secretory pathway protein FliH